MRSEQIAQKEAGESSINRQYKDRLFKFIFGNAEHKDWTLSLYNAVNGTDYDNPDDIELTTIEDVLYLGMKNDVSFIVAEVLNLYEQQSTYNPNMPMRLLIYAGMAYARNVQSRDSYLLYKDTQVEFPVPKCVCFYNGAREEPEKVILYLRDAFPEGSDPDIDVRVTMLNINYGKNKQLLEKSKPLGEYSWTVERIRQEQKSGKTVGEAVDTAIDEMPGDWLLKPFLMANRAEVRRMCLTEYNEEEAHKAFIEHGREQGLEQGRGEGRAENMSMLRRLHQALIEAGRDIDILSVPEDQLEQLFAEYNIH